MRARSKFDSKVRSGIAGAALATVGGVCLWTTPIGQGLDHLSYDIPGAFNSRFVSDEVVIVQMDEASSRELRPYDGAVSYRPWHALLLDRLKADGCKLVVFDFFLKRPSTEDADNELIRALKNFNEVVLAVDREPVLHPTIRRYTLVPNWSNFVAVATNWGIAAVEPDTDGVVRKHYPGMALDPSLPWVAATLARLSQTNAPLDRRVEQERWLRYYGPIGTIPGLSYHSAFDQAAGYFRGKTVFVGGKPLTPGVLDESDEFPTPYTWKDGKYTPGVEIMATTFLNLLHGDWLSRLSSRWEFLSIVLAGCLFGFGLNLIRPLVGAGLGIVGMAAVTAFALWLFWHWNIWFSWVVIAGFQIPCAWICSVVAHTMRTEHEKEELEEKLSTQRASQQSTVRAFDEPRSSRTDNVANVPNHELIRCIGKGAFGEVWLARNQIGTYHAAKIIYRNNFTSMESYAREFKGIQKYMPVSRAHPGLVQILHIGRNDADGYYFYIMECGDDEVLGADFKPETYSARNLAKDLRKCGKMPVADCVSMSLDLANALGFLHGHSLIHRDIKPSNIIFVNGALKLADIGLVTTIAVRGTETSQQGTPGYMAPDGDLRTPAADIYSLGKVIYEASTGHRVDQFPVLPTWLAEGEQTTQLLELNPIILKCCEEDARRRYQSADELRADLLNWQRKFPTRKGSKGD